MKKYMFILILMLVLISACGKKKSENKNMEQILSEQGIPIRVTEIQPGNFVQQLKYNSSLTGIEESVVKSLLADVVLSVKVKVGDRVSKGQVLVSFPKILRLPSMNRQKLPMNLQNRAMNGCKDCFRTVRFPDRIWTTWKPLIKYPRPIWMPPGRW